MLDLLTDVFEVLGLLCISVAAAVVLWPFSPALGMVSTGALLIVSSLVLTKLGGSR